MNLHYIYTDTDIDWQQLTKLYEKTLGEKDTDILKKTFNYSMYKCFLYDSDQLIGAGRALADGADTSYLCDIAVLPEYQGMGLGKQIVAYLLEKSQGYNKIFLYTFPEKESFYKQFGFTKLKTGMVIFNKNPHKAESRGII